MIEQAHPFIFIIVAQAHVHHYFTGCGHPNNKGTQPARVKADIVKSEVVFFCVIANGVFDSIYRFGH